MEFYLLIAIAGCWPLVARLIKPDKFTWTEVGTQMVVAFVIATVGWNYGIYSKASRVEIWNGEVTGKNRNEVSCTHDYKCHCKMVYVGEGKDRHLEEECETCYRHPYDVDWEVTSNVGNFDIPRVDSQGLWTPPRWSKFQQGQPIAREHDYQNYVAAQGDSLFHKNAEEMKDLPEVPGYPRVKDYQYANRVLPVGVTLADWPLWNADLADYLKELGPQKQANIIVILVNTPDRMYRYKVEAAWGGVNKNDIVVLMGVGPEDLNILWTDVITFADNSGNEELQVNLRNKLLEIGTAERTKVLPAVADDVRTLFERPHMKDFDYLKNRLEPTTWFKILFGIAFLIANLGLTIWFRNVDFNIRDALERTKTMRTRA